MHQVVGSHDCNGAGSDHKSLEDIRVKLFPFPAATIQTLHRIAQQGLVLRRAEGGTVVQVSIKVFGC